ncbi:AraC family transcriptional regulator ligand-binding domain-containing protein [Pseudomonadota bacterium]
MVIKPPGRPGSRRAAQNGGTKKEHQDSTVRVGPMGQIPSILRTLKIDPGLIFDDIGFTLEQFKDPDLKISYLKAGQLLSRCVAESNCEHFGLLLGSSTTPSRLGVPGFLAQSAPNVARALSDLIHNMDLHDSGGSPTLHSSNGATF